MSLFQISVILGSIGAYALPVLERSNIPDFTSIAGDAPYSVDAATLAAALTCPNGIPNSNAPPVLLVHGTGTTGSETWGEGYVPALSANGYTPCYVDLPERALGDMQVSSEYIAYNLHYISYLSGGLKTAVISHSQGGPDTQWALQFWPSTHSATSIFVALSPDFAGIELFDSELSNICIGDLCQAALWQQSAGSNYYNALHHKNFDAQVPTTVVWSSDDGVVTPAQQNAQLPSATVIEVQDLCPGRIVNHVFMPIDAAGYAIALDALTHGGAASLSRLEPNVLGICLSITAPNMNVNVAVQLGSLLDDLINGYLLGGPRVSSEPAVMAYALS